MITLYIFHTIFKLSILKVLRKRKKDRHKEILYASSSIKIENLFFSIIFDLYLIGLLLQRFIGRFFLRKKKQIWGVVHIPIWGNYDKIYQSFLQRNLLSSSNKNFSKKNGITLLFSCTSSHRDSIRRHPDFSLLKKYYNINFDIVSPRLFKLANRTFLPHIAKYSILGTIQSHALSYAKKISASSLPLYADVIIDKEFFSKIHDIASKGFDCILSNCFRSELEGICSFLKGENYGALELSGQEIVNLQCRFLHPISHGRIISLNKLCSITDQLIFIENGSLFVKSFTWTPLFISKKLIKSWEKKFFQPIDSDSSFLVKEFKERLFFIEEAATLGICEVSGLKSLEKKVLSGKKSLELFLFKRFKERENFKRFKERDNAQLFFFSKQAKFTPTFKLNLKYKEVNTKKLEAKFFKLFERKNK